MKKLFLALLSVSVLSTPCLSLRPAVAQGRPSSQERVAAMSSATIRDHEAIFDALEDYSHGREEPAIAKLNRVLNNLSPESEITPEYINIFRLMIYRNVAEALVNYARPQIIANDIPELFPEKQLKQAVHYLKEAINIEDNSYMARIHLGDAYVMLGRLPAAEAQYAAAWNIKVEKQQVDPINRAAHLELQAAIYNNMGYYSKGNALYREANEIHRRNGDETAIRLNEYLMEDGY